VRVIFLRGSRVGWSGPSTAGAGTPSHRVQIAAPAGSGRRRSAGRRCTRV